MPSVNVKRFSEIVRSPRVLQVESMFDVPPSKRSELTWQANLPVEERDWNIGLIVGPSGSGKTTVARELFGDAIVDGFEWDKDKSVVDSFPSEMPIKDIIALLGAVGFNSPPNWLRPFNVLSNGEQFRVNMARALAEASDLIVVDEFTSVVDRQVAKIACHAFQKTIRRKNIKFIAVSCHDDIVDWLQPDWVFQPGADDFKWRHLQRHPPIELQIARIDKSHWRYFKHHHYLTGSISGSAKCFGGFINGKCVAFAACNHFAHPKTKNIIHGHRTVVFPDYQGLGISGKMVEWIAHYYFSIGKRYRRVTAHPAIIAYCLKSPRWKFVDQSKLKAIFSEKSAMKKRIIKGAVRRTFTFEYVAPIHNDCKEARQ